MPFYDPGGRFPGSVFSMDDGEVFGYSTVHRADGVETFCRDLHADFELADIIGCVVGCVSEKIDLFDFEPDTCGVKFRGFFKK